MAHFLLVHGAAHGAWCWRDLLPELTAKGHSVQAIDLPGHGQDSTPYQQVTLDNYADAILSALPKNKRASFVETLTRIARSAELGAEAAREEAKKAKQAEKAAKAKTKAKPADKKKKKKKKKSADSA